MGIPGNELADWLAGCGAEGGRVGRISAEWWLGTWMDAQLCADNTRSDGTGPTLTLRVISLNFGPVVKRLRSFSWTVFFCKSSWHVCLTQMQHLLWLHMMHTNNECAYNMNPVNVRV